MRALLLQIPSNSTSRVSEEEEDRISMSSNAVEMPSYYRRHRRNSNYSAHSGASITAADRAIGGGSVFTNALLIDREELFH